MRIGPPMPMPMEAVEDVDNAHAAAVADPVGNAVCPLDSANAPIALALVAMDHANSANYCFKNNIPSSV